jgi:flagellar basal-body rod protein FlgC
MSGLSAAIAASASALDAQRARIEVAVSNIANAESTRGPDGQPYRRRDVVLATDAQHGFDIALGQAGVSRVRVAGVKVAGIVEDQSPFQRRYDPSHPDADSEGFVAMPNVDTPEEMVNMMSASRAYQANLTAIGLIRDLVQKSLEIGK